MTEEKKPAIPHHLILDERQHLALTGVADVDQYNESAVTIRIDGGTLTVRGRDLQIVRLNVESGEMQVDGTIDELTYAVSRGKGIFGRLFR